MVYLRNFAARPRLPSRPNVHVGFAPEVDLWIGLEDCHKMYHTRVPLDTMACGISPWSCPNFEEQAAPSRSLDFTASSDASGHLAIHRLAAQPTWAAPIWNLLCQHGTTDDEEEGPLIFVNSFYIDHHRFPMTEELRPLRFDSDVQEWERDIRFIWEDMIDAGAPLYVAVVQPDPPHSAYRGTVATVLFINILYQIMQPVSQLQCTLQILTLILEIVPIHSPMS